MPSRQNGILIANYSLVLQHVRLNDAGHYSCQAENYIGATESNKHELMIKCKHNTVVDFTIKFSKLGIQNITEPNLKEIKSKIVIILANAQ